MLNFGGVHSLQFLTIQKESEENTLPARRSSCSIKDSFASLPHSEFHCCHLGVSENSGTPKSSISIGFSIINHPFWGTPILETPIYHHQLQPPSMILCNDVLRLRVQVFIFFLSACQRTQHTQGLRQTTEDMAGIRVLKALQKPSRN